MIKKLLESLLFKLYRAISNRQEEWDKIIHTDRIKRKVKKFGKGSAINGFAKILHPKGINIGNNVHIGNGALIDGRGGVIIEDNVHISRNLTLYTSNHHYESGLIPYDHTLIPGSVLVENGVWIGMNVNITPGVTIGRGAIIGMGTTVSKDVAPGEIVVSSSQKVIGNRNMNDFDSNLKQNQLGGAGGIRLLKKTESLSIEEAELCFILSTGRAGSNSLGIGLKKHPDIHSEHELFYTQLKVLSLNYILGFTSRKEVKQELILLFSSVLIPNNKKIYIESDQKLTPFIEILNEIFPKSKFVWLIRNPKDFIKSAKVRGWFIDDKPKFFKDTVIIDPNQYSDGCRVTGDLVNEFSEKEWDALSQDDKISWYWVYWNRLIYDGLEKLDKSRSFYLPLETMDQKIPELLEFLSIDSVKDLEIKKSNTVKQKHKKQYEKIEDFNCNFFELDNLTNLYRQNNLKELFGGK